MKNIIFTFMVAYCFTIFFAACSNDELLPDFIYEMTVSSETINVVSEGATETIEVNSNFNWTVESNAEWCKPTIKGGSAGSSSFQIIVEKNEKIEERLAEVTVKAGSVERKIEVVQLNPDGFEIVDMPTSITVDGLENVIQLKAKTNLKLEVTSADGWAVMLEDEVASGNPPRQIPLRIMFKDNVTGSPRTSTVSINGKGLPTNYAKTFEVTQQPAPEANINDERILGTWLVTRAMNGTSNDLALLGKTMIFEANGLFKENSSTGAVIDGTWNVRGERLSIYYSDNTRRYLYLEETGESIKGRMTSTDINSEILFESTLSQATGGDCVLSLVDVTNTKVVYMMVINGDVSKYSEYGLVMGRTKDPTMNDKKFVGKGGNVVVGEITKLLSGDTYHIRGYRVEGSNTLYTENIQIDMPVKDYDGNQYKIVKIGDQYWLAENLRTTHYNNGDEILYCDKNHNAEFDKAGRSDMVGAFSWIFGEAADWQWTADTFNQNVSDHSAKAYGGIYNWYAVADERGIAPEGWHVPSKAELMTLLESIGASTEDFAAGDMNYMNGLLAHDHYANSAGWNGWACSGRNGDGTWKGWDTLGARETTWWSIDVRDSNYPWLLYHRRGDGGDSGISWTHKYEGWQVRCVRDAGK